MREVEGISLARERSQNQGSFRAEHLSSSALFRRCMMYVGHHLLFKTGSCSKTYPCCKFLRVVLQRYYEDDPRAWELQYIVLSWKRYIYTYIYM